jgi:hypothetical protein
VEAEVGVPVDGEQAVVGVRRLHELAIDPDHANKTYFSRIFDLTADPIPQVEKVQAVLKPVLPGDEWDLSGITFREHSSEIDLASSQRELQRVVRMVTGNPHLHELIRQRRADYYTRIQIIRINGLRSLTAAVSGRKDPSIAALGATNKMFWSEYARDLGAWGMNLRGAQSMIRPDGEGYPLDGWQADFLGSRSGTIWGGTAQVQRNIVGERVLGLPKEPGHEGTN